jgi:hypothetical protein
MAIDKQWVCNVPRYDAQIINLDIINIINKMDTPTSTQVCWFDYPYVLLWFFLLNQVVML